MKPEVGLGWAGIKPEELVLSVGFGRDSFCLFSHSVFGKGTKKEREEKIIIMKINCTFLYVSLHKCTIYLKSKN